MREDAERRVAVGEALTIDSAADGVALLAWAVRVVQDAGFEIVGMDPAAVSVRRAEIGGEMDRDRRDACPTERERTRLGEPCHREPCHREPCHREPCGREPCGREPEQWTGAVCGACGSTRLVASGSCATCHDCGATTGCG
jgi:hypothetical protein